MKLYFIQIIIFAIGFFIASVSADDFKPPDNCPQNHQELQLLYTKSYKNLLLQLAKGESGKLNTPQKEKAAKTYHFYADCLKKESQNSLLKSCASYFDSSKNILSIDMKAIEKEPYESLKRVEISIRNKDNKEFFRAMNNRMNHPAPIPPNDFGVYLANKKLSDIKSVGQEANIPIKTKYAFLLPGSKTSTNNGILEIHWEIKMLNRNYSDGNIHIFVKIVPKEKKDTTWISCTPPIWNTQSVSPPRKKSAEITPLICFHKNDCHTPDRITLLHLSRQKRKGVVKRWSGDTACTYSYKELSKELIDMKNLPDKKIILESGFYRFEYNDVRGNPPAGFYGKSEVFEVKAGGVIEIKVRLNSAL